VAEYLTLFAIVLTHEFGHALACRSVGGQANRIVLWPLGGVAYVAPPPRPGATLWSIAAGPLVNVVLVPLTLGPLFLGSLLGWWQPKSDLLQFLYAVASINLVLLCFNILPIYPLDGGQILRSLLWFFMGRARSLMAVAVFGFVGVAGLFALAAWEFVAAPSGSSGGLWLGAIAVFMLLRCWVGFKHAQTLLRLEAAPQRVGFSCPVCHTPPPMGDFWRCNKCRSIFDTFSTGAVCPNCQAKFDVTVCSSCGARKPMAEWAQASGQAL
jgi:Zn-dependent protease/predicted RNA-binding Zn-ribbon protein involved in translation (DUF1610 family)